MDFKQKRPQLGLLTAIIFLFSFALAVANYPGYNPTSNFLSDLGVGKNSAPYFNYGLMLTGICGMLFGFAIFKSFKGKIEKIGAVLYIISNLFLIGVGLFTEAEDTMHLVVSVAFFGLSAISFLAIGISLRRKPVGIASILLSLPAIIFSLTGFMPIVEHIAVLSIGIWILVFSFSTFHQV